MSPFRIKSNLPQHATNSIFPPRPLITINAPLESLIFMAFPFVTHKWIEIPYGETPNHKIIRNSDNPDYRAFIFSLLLDSAPVLISFFGLNATSLRVDNPESGNGMILLPGAISQPIFFSGDIVLSISEGLTSRLGYSIDPSYKKFSVGVSMLSLRKAEIVVI